MVAARLRSILKDVRGKRITLYAAGCRCEGHLEDIDDEGIILVNAIITNGDKQREGEVLLIDTSRGIIMELDYSSAVLNLYHALLWRLAEEIGREVSELTREEIIKVLQKYDSEFKHNFYIWYKNMYGKDLRKGVDGG